MGASRCCADLDYLRFAKRDALVVCTLKSRVSTSAKKGEVRFRRRVGSKSGCGGLGERAQKYRRMLKNLWSKKKFFATRKGNSGADQDKTSGNSP
jgi:hypothetical protein